MNFRKSVQFRILTGITLTIAITITAFTVFEYNNEKKLKLKALNLSSTECTHRLSYTLVTPLWDLNTDETRRLIENEIAPENILGIEVKDGEEKTVSVISKDLKGTVVDGRISDNTLNLKFTQNIIKEDKKIGSVLITVSQKQLLRELGDSLLFQILKSVIEILFICIIVFLMMRLFIIRPIESLTDRLKDIAEGEGDLTRRIDIKGEDEIARLAGHFNTFIETIRETVKRISESTMTITDSAAELTTAAHQISNNAESMSDRSNVVASATEEATSNISTISTSAKDMSSGIYTVAAAIEEINASLSEVARHCVDESEIVTEANRQAKSTDTLMEELNVSAVQIGRVIEVINDIAEQTNLLALNATIEAASAGEAGRGFAVVASEVKALASQTAQATEEIEKKVDGIQKSSLKARTAINAVSAIIEKLNGISQVIVAAVEEQTSTVNEIAKTIGNSRNFATSIAQNVSESALGLTEISQSIQMVNTSASETSKGVKSMLHSAEKLDTLASDLSGLIRKFKI